MSGSRFTPGSVEENNDRPEIGQTVSDDMSRIARLRILRDMSTNITTEDLETIHQHFPHLMEEALHEILNPEVSL